MAIFQSSVLKKYLKQLNEDAVAKAYKKYTKYFHDTTIQQNIRESKEEQYQAKFLDELFVIKKKVAFEFKTVVEELVYALDELMVEEIGIVEGSMKD